MSLKDIILNKGWAGRTISRPETVERLNPIVQSLSTILNIYNRLTIPQEGKPGEDSSEQSEPTTAEFPMNDQVRLLRMDIGKLSETIASCGGSPTRSVAPLSHGEGYSWGDLQSEEERHLNVIVGEGKVEHQMRTRAILAVLSDHAKTRIQLLRQLRSLK